MNTDYNIISDYVFDEDDELMEIYDFIYCIDNGIFSPDDGRVSSVLINNKLTNICVTKWGVPLKKGNIEMSIYELKNLNHEFLLVWHSK